MNEEKPIPPADVLAALERILSSPGFATAGRGSRFLRYVVEQTLAGNGELKEFTLGVEVFDRGDTYDPRVDSIVRVEAGRLRTKLEEYYNGVGKGDPVRINLPRGGYVPQFEKVGHHFSGAGVNQPVVGRPFSGAVAVGILTVAILLAIWFVWRQPPHTGTTIAVLAFEQYSDAPEDVRLAAQLTSGVTSELARLGTIGVASHTSAMQFAGIRKPLKEIATALNADVVLEAEVRNELTNEGAAIRVTARMVDATVDRKMWVEDFPGTRAELRDLERRIAAAASVAALTKRPASR